MPMISLIIHWQHYGLHNWQMAFRNCMAKYQEQCGVSMMIFARSFQLPMHKTGVTGPINNCISFRKKVMIMAFDDRKKYLKKRAFEIVADQTGKII